MSEGGAGGGVVGRGTMLQARRLPSIPVEVIEFFIWPNPSSRIMALGLTQPLRNEYEESSWG
jgi:hypothetical protein